MLKNSLKRFLCSRDNLEDNDNTNECRSFKKLISGIEQHYGETPLNFFFNYVLDK